MVIFFQFFFLQRKSKVYQLQKNFGIFLKKLFLPISLKYSTWTGSITTVEYPDIGYQYTGNISTVVYLDMSYQYTRVTGFDLDLDFEYLDII